MEFKLNKKELLEVLLTGSKFAGTNRTISMFDNVRIKMSSGNLTVESTNGENAIKSHIAISNSTGDFDFCIQPQDLVKYIKSLKDTELTFVKNSHSLVLKHNKGNVEFAITDSEMYPDIPKIDSNTVYELDSNLLGNWINICRGFAATDNLRPIMCGMYIFIKGNRVGVCATDTRILFADEITTDTDYSDDASCVIPSSVFNALSDVLGKDNIVRVKINENNIVFKSGNTVILCKLQLGNFPAYERVIPANNDIVAEINKSELRDMVSRSNLISNKSTSLLTVNVSGMSLNICSEDADNGKKMTEECMCVHQGNDISIGAAGDMFVTCLDAIESDDLILTFREPQTPILIHDRLNPNRRVILMPVMVR